MKEEICYTLIDGIIAQLAEHLLDVQVVMGSSPFDSTMGIDRNLEQ